MIPSYCQYPEYNNYFQTKGWLVETVEKTHVLIQPLSKLGSLVKIKRANPDILLSVLDDIAKKHKALLVKLEINIEMSDPRVPQIREDLAKNEYHASRYAFCPTKTICLDLAPREDVLLARSSSDVRRYLRKGRESEAYFRFDGTLRDFYPLLVSAGKQKGYGVARWDDFLSQWGSFGDDMKLVLAYQNGTLIGGSMTLCRGSTAHGMFMAVKKGASPKTLSYSLLWESILVAKRAGCETLDFDGIYDPRFRAHKTWQGLTAFKKKFGGREVEFLGPFVKSTCLPLKVFAQAGLL